MSIFGDIGDAFSSTGGQIGAVVGGLITGGPIGVVVGAVAGNAIEEGANSAGDTIRDIAVGARNIYDTVSNGTSDNLTYAFEISGFDGGDITNWVDASTYSDYEYTLPGAVGQFDTEDLYSFNLGYSSDFYTNLTGLGADADLYLYDGNFNLLGSSENLGTANESISQTLSPGNYFIDVISYDYTTTSYGLTVGSTQGKRI